MSGQHRSANDYSDSTSLAIAQNAWIRFFSQRTASTNKNAQEERGRTLIQEEVLKAQRIIPLLRRRQNMLLPISLLPPEILSHIFLLLHKPIVLEEDWYISPRSWLLSITRVCSVWRSVALGCVGLWTSIPFHIGPRWSQAFSERSRGAALSIAINMSTITGSSWECSFMKDQIARVKTLAFRGVVGDGIADVFNILASDAPERLVSLTLSSQFRSDLDTALMMNAYSFAPVYASVLNNAPSLRELHMYHIPLPWNVLPWGRLRRVTIDLGVAGGAVAMGDLYILVASLASAQLLETLAISMDKTVFRSVTLGRTVPADLSNLQSFQFKGYSDDFQRLWGAIRIPTTAALDIILVSKDHRPEASSAAVSEALRAHSGYNQPRFASSIHALQLSCTRSVKYAWLKAWQSDVDFASATSGLDPFIAVTLCLPIHSADGKTVDSQLAGLCRNVNLSSLRQLHISLGDVDPKARSITHWDEGTFRTLFSSACSVEQLHVEGPYVQPLFNALSAPVDAATPSATPEQRNILFPALRNIYLSDFDEEYTRKFSPVSLPDCIESRARHAPIAALHIRDSSVSEDALARLRAVEGLELVWDGKQVKRLAF